MTTLIWDCFSGIAGNMAVASLLDLGADVEKLKKAIDSLEFVEGPLELVIEEKLNMGIRGVYFNSLDDYLLEHSHNHEHDHGHNHDHGHTHNHDHEHSHSHNNHAHDHEHDHDHEHAHEHAHSHAHDHGHGHHHGPHRGMPEIRALIEKAQMTERAKEIAISCFTALAQAEAHIHGKPVDEVHFHEVGARDSIADMVGAAVCLDDLNVSEVLITPVHLGSGMVKCAHGLIPVPAPATAILLQGLPVVIDNEVSFELTTPTGAALLKGLAAKPVFTREFLYEKVGHGLGSRQTGRPNFLRAFLSNSENSSKKKADFVVKLSTSLDNVTGELLGHAASSIMASGALDFCIFPVTMKKGRPGFVLEILAAPQMADQVEKQVFAELPTLGIRRQMIQRSILERESAEEDSCFGLIKGKRITEIDGRQRFAAEFDEKVRLSEREKMPVRRLKIPD